MRIATYIYNARVTRVIDGDTFEADIDLGFGSWQHDVPLRVADVYCPEPNEPGGPEAKDFLWTILIWHRIVVETRKVPKTGRDRRSFARYVADVQLPTGEDLATVIIAAGHGSRVPPAS